MLKSFTKAIGKIFGTKYDRDVKGYMPNVRKINELGGQLQKLSHDELRGKTLDCHSQRSTR